MGFLEELLGVAHLHASLPAFLHCEGSSRSPALASCKASEGPVLGGQMGSCAEGYLGRPRDFKLDPELSNRGSGQACLSGPSDFPPSA